MLIIAYFTTHKWTFHKDHVYKIAEDIKVLKKSDEVNLGFTKSVLGKVYYKLPNRKFILKKESNPINAARRLSLYA